MFAQFFSSQQSNFKKWVGIVVGFFLILCFFLPKPSFDWWSYVTWADHFRKVGFSNAYVYPLLNYMPINLFPIQIWQLASQVGGWDLRQTFHYLKVFPVFFDCLTVLLLLGFAKKYRLSPLWVGLLFLPNIAFHYNSFIWGQFDSVYTFFVLLSLYALLNKQPLLAALAFLLSLNSKFQAAIFVPPLLLVAAAQYPLYRYRLAGLLGFIVLTVATLLVTQMLLFLPFSANSPIEIIQLVWHRSAALSEYVTFNADNFWILVGAVTMKTLDSSIWLLGITYKKWGYILFSFITGGVMLPLFFMVVTTYIHHFFPQKKLSLPRIDQIAALDFMKITSLIFYLQGLSFFFFFTQMHERYAHPVIVFSGLFALLTKKKSIFLVSCLAYLINLERINRFWSPFIQLNNIFGISIVAALFYAIGLVIAVFELYTLYREQIEQKSN